VNPVEVAGGLLPFVKPGTLIVASSDLSHFHPDAEARELDAACVKAVCELDLESLKKQEACGKAPLTTLVELARKKGWKTKKLDYRNSGDSTGDKASVVGYAAIAFYEPGKPDEDAEGGMEAKGIYAPEEQAFMLKLARQTLERVVKEDRFPDIQMKDVPEKLKEKKGCFVTLTVNGQLRGCIGHIIPMEPLYKSIMDNARSASLEDPRFNRVEVAELAKIRIEISVLTTPEPLKFDSPEDLLKKLKPNVDGVVLHVGGGRSTYLPQVWEQLPDPEQFLNHLSEKAGMPASAWRKPDTEVQIYHVEAMHENRD
jgi:MEMO1 family protein